MPPPRRWRVLALQPKKPTRFGTDRNRIERRITRSLGAAHKAGALGERSVELSYNLGLLCNRRVSTNRRRNATRSPSTRNRFCGSDAEFGAALKRSARKRSEAGVSKAVRGPALAGNTSTKTFVAILFERRFHSVSLRPLARRGRGHLRETVQTECGDAVDASSGRASSTTDNKIMAEPLF